MAQGLVKVNLSTWRGMRRARVADWDRSVTITLEKFASKEWRLQITFAPAQGKVETLVEFLEQEYNSRKEALSELEGLLKTGWRKGRRGQGWIPEIGFKIRAKV